MKDCYQNEEYTPPKEDLEDHEPDTMYPEGHWAAPKSYMRICQCARIPYALDNHLRYRKNKKRRFNHNYE